MQKRVLLALAGACALIGFQGSAMALTRTHGSICKAYGDNNQAEFFTSTIGIINVGSDYQGVICPIVRTASPPSSGFKVWVDGLSDNGYTTSCSLQSYSDSGNFLGSSSFDATGTYSRLLVLPASQVPKYSTQFIYCDLPGGENGVIYDVEPLQ